MPPGVRKQSSSTSGRGRVKKTIEKNSSKTNTEALSSAKVNDPQTEIWLCKLCESLFENDDDKLMQCERCKENICCKETCLNMPDLEYTFYKEHPHCHWFCSECEAPALKSVQTDMEIEERCSEFMKVYDERLQKVETDLTNKAEKTVVDKLSIFRYFDTLKTEYYAKGCVRENKSKKFKVRIKRMTVRNENR